MGDVACCKAWLHAAGLATVESARPAALGIGCSGVGRLALLFGQCLGLLLLAHVLDAGECKGQREDGVEDDRDGAVHQDSNIAFRHRQCTAQLGLGQRPGDHRDQYRYPRSANALTRRTTLATKPYGRRQGLVTSHS